MNERAYGGQKLETIEDFALDQMKIDMAAHIRELQAENAKLKADSLRLQFVIDSCTSWYPGRVRDGSGRGILCWDEGNERRESIGLTMRDAIDAAIVEQELNK